MNKINVLILPSIIIVIILVIISNLFANQVFKKDLSLLNSQVDLLFEGNNSVSDGQLISLNGNFDDPDKMNYTLTNGGFIIYELNKENQGFVKSIIMAGHLKYKVAERSWMPAMYSTDPWSGEKTKVMEGYSYPSLRRNIDICYSKSFNFLLTGSKDYPKNNYKPGIFTDLKDFPKSFQSNYYYIDTEKHPTENYYNQELIGQVNAYDYDLTYSQLKLYLAIQPFKGKIQKTRSKFLGGGLAVAFIITLIMNSIVKKPRIPSHIGNSLFDKKWKNTGDNSMLSFRLSTLGKCIVTLINENKSSTGKALLRMTEFI